MAEKLYWQKWNRRGDVIKRSSAKLQLSREYANHCIWATVVTTLCEAGMDNLRIQAVTGNKNSLSVDRYKRLNSENSCKDCA
jgi:hypothetical protein